MLLTYFLFLNLLQWQTENSRPFEVMLVLISFLIAWAEAWFIDFRVLPQEARARSILEGKEIKQIHHVCIKNLEGKENICIYKKAVL